MVSLGGSLGEGDTMITAKPFKRKGLRPSEAPSDTTKPDSSQDYSDTILSPRQDLIEALDVALSKIHKATIKEPPRPLSYEKFNKLVFYTVTGTGGIDARHCDLLIKEFMTRYNYCFGSNPPDLPHVLKKLVEQGKIEKVMVNKRNYYYNWKEKSYL